MDWPPTYQKSYTPPSGQEYWRPELETMAPERRDAVVLEKLRHQVRYAVTRSGFYKEFYRDDEGIQGENLLGVVLTALLLSLGAPFWFEMLSKLSSLRE